MKSCKAPRLTDAFGEVCRGCIRFFNKSRGLWVFFGLTFSAFAAERSQVLQAIHLVENPNNSTRVGSRGELGPYQFRPGTWRMHTKKPFSLATDVEESDLVAEKHYEWLRAGLERAGVSATPYKIALAWNAGLTATVRGQVSRASRNYASRVENLVTQAVAAAPVTPPSAVAPAKNVFFSVAE